MNMKKIFCLLVLICSLLTAHAQTNKAAKNWVNTTFKSLSKEEKIAQSMIVRAHSNLGPEHVASVTELIKKYNPGGLIFFQGGPLRQALLTNSYQSIAKTPLLITIDGEWGLAMRLDSVTRFPFQSTLGALSDDRIVYGVGQAIAQQMKRMGIYVNFAPVVDVNNNPNNPVIGYRSFGEDKYKVARFGVAYMKGMQDAGIMACAKHFPGHGDVDVDSHLDLPVIHKTIDQLDSLELYPFKQLFNAGVGSVMIAHLSIPAIDTTTHLPTSLSKKNVTGLLRDDLKYNGLTFTDALEMKGVTKYYPAGEAAVLALIAGNDMLCLPEDVPAAIDAIKLAVKNKRIKQKDIDAKVKKVLYAKYALGLYKPQFIDTTNLIHDINAKTDSIDRVVAANTITLLRNEAGAIPISPQQKIAYLAIDTTNNHAITSRLKQELNATIFNFSYKEDSAKAALLAQQINAGKFDVVLIGVHDYSLKTPNNFNITGPALYLWNSVQSRAAITLLFGNVYAAKNFCNTRTLLAFYQDDPITENAAADFLINRTAAKGKLPVTVCNIPYGTSVSVGRFAPAGFSPEWLKVDSIMSDGIKKKAYPGAVVLAIQNGVVKYHKAFGSYEFDSSSKPITLESIYDLASVTKISATTVALMKLYDEGRLDLDKTLGDYLPLTKGTDKAPLKIRDVLLHQAGLLDVELKYPPAEYVSDHRDSQFNIPVARNIWLRKDWEEMMLQRIINNRLGTKGKYLYTDADFILLGKVVEQITGMPLNKYVEQIFYKPLNMVTTDFKPWERFGVERVVPTEQDNSFRKQLLQGYVHDENAALLGGVAGHAGLFSNAYDLSVLYQMLLNGGSFNGHQFIKPETVKLFTSYNSNNSRRGLGFDKPEKDNNSRSEPYPSASASPSTFGHTGFTGTAVWADPQSGLVYIFLSNRVNAGRNNVLQQMNIRGKVMDAIYQALQKEKQ